MGKIRNGILGGLSGKVGNIVGAQWKGIDYIRSRPDHVKNPRTRAQVEQRNKFKGVQNLAKCAKYPFIQPIWDKAAVKMSGANLFVQRNIKAFNSRGELEDFDKIQVAIGPCQFPAEMSLTYEPENNGIRFLWSGEEFNNDDGIDRMINVAIYKKGNDHPRLLYDFSCLSMKSADLLVDEYEKGAILHFYVFLSEDNFSRFSDSRYFRIEL